MRGAFRHGGAGVFRGDQDDAGRYAWISAVFRQLRCADRGALPGCLQRQSCASRAQVTRQVRRRGAEATLLNRYCSPAHAFARKYWAGDIALLAEADRARDTLSGPATA